MLGSGMQLVQKPPETGKVGGRLFVKLLRGLALSESSVDMLSQHGGSLRPIRIL